MGVEVKYSRDDENYRVNVTSYIGFFGLTAGVKVVVEHRSFQRPWYWPWGNPVPVWQEIAVPAIAISAQVFWPPSPVFLPTTFNNTSRAELPFTYRSIRGLITGIKGTVNLTLGIGQNAPTMGSISTSEGDSGNTA